MPTPRCTNLYRTYRAQKCNKFGYPRIWAYSVQLEAQELSSLVPDEAGKDVAKAAPQPTSPASQKAL